MGSTVAQQIEIARKRLLDTSARNRLIHYKGSKTVGAEVQEGESADHAFDWLVTKGRALRLVGQPDPTGGEDDESVEPVRAEVDATDDVLTCRETASRLSKKLLKTFRDQRTLMEETGVNTLFLALGRLKWADPKVQEGDRSSPLLLVPVILERKANTNRYLLTWDGQEVIENLSLGALLKEKFGVDLPSFEITEDTKPSEAFQRLAALAGARGWNVVTDEISLAFFSSAKYLMYADLDPARWESSLSDHADLQVIFDPDPDHMYRDAPDPLPSGSIDPIRPVSACTEVVDCDGSQLSAIMQAAQGKTMVIEGPPGTGKSQTITNLLADCVARGKTVLFVAEKQAALNVVARNLERVGLRSLCLELHSHNTNKKSFHQSIVATLDDQPSAPGVDFPFSDLQRVRDGLNQYAEAVNKSLEEFGRTPREIMGEILKLGHDTTEGLRLPESEAQCDREQLSSRREAARSIDLWISQNGTPYEHPFRFVTRYLDPVECQRIVSQTLSLRDRLIELERAARAAVDQIQAGALDRFADIDRLCLALEAIAERPALSGMNLNAARTASGPEIRELLAKGSRWAKLQSQWSPVLVPAAERSDLDALKSEWDGLRRSPLRIFDPRYHKCRKKLNALARTGFASDESRTAGIEAAKELRDLAAEVSAGKAAIQEVFPGAACSTSDPWTERRVAWEWLEKSRDAVESGLLPATFFDQPLELDLAEVKTCLLSLRRARDSFASARVKVEALGASLPHERLSDLRSLLNAAVSKQESITAWVAYLDLESKLAEIGIPSLAAFSRQGAPTEQIVARSYFERALRRVYEDPSLRAFSLTTQETQLERFRELDRQLLLANRQRIRLKHRQDLPKGHGGAGGLGAIQREATKRRRHQPIRKTMQTAWPAIQKIKPIFMMSPVSVAMYLPQDGPRFDVVIFDEASQVRPEEAIGAIARASQAIVVGDTKQMPPTNFFQNMMLGDDADGDDGVPPATEGLESILDVVSARIPKGSHCRKDLRWHYRSRHETLITPSNGLFYDWRLFIVPNPSPPDSELGLVYNHLPHAYYDRGNSRTNREEARAVADAIVQNLEVRPQESVMAVAFSAAQQQAIQDEVDLRLGHRPDLLAAYQARHPTEPIDVKNLENVQGDERDVVLISIGYGKNEQGYFAQTFGPLNQDGGGRRLNVLITRARKRCEVFTNLEPEDVKPDGNPGRYALRTFLAFARSGHMDVPNKTGRDPMSVFEEQVMDALTRSGFECEPQVGVAGFFIDIGVRHPDQPHKFCLGIECDGAQYHSSKTARDRDRLRQAVLESRGWTIHRIWSTDWFTDPKGCLERTVAAIRKACERSEPNEAPQQAPDPADIPLTVPAAVNAEQGPSLSRSLSFDPYEPVRPTFPIPWDYDMLCSSPSSVMLVMHEIVAGESPICLAEVIRRLREAARGGKAGSRIAPLLASYASRLQVPGHAYESEWFVPSGERAKPRDRSHLDASFKKPDLIHDLEIMAAMGRIVEAEVVVPRDRLAKEALRLLGIGRVSQQASQRLDLLVDEAIAKGWIEETSAGLMLPKRP